MKIKLLIIIGLVVLLAYFTYPWFLSAGGVGSLASYKFNVSRAVLSSKIDSLTLNNDTVGVPSKQIYSLEGTGYEDDSKYIYYINNIDDTLVYSYEFYNYSSGESTSIALTHFGKYGDTPLKTSRDIFFFQENSKAKGFEEIINKLNIPYKKNP